MRAAVRKGNTEAMGVNFMMSILIGQREDATINGSFQSDVNFVGVKRTGV
jgi:hypothetical protein